jgi:hypothetical protein
MKNYQERVELGIRLAIWSRERWEGRRWNHLVIHADGDQEMERKSCECAERDRSGLGQCRQEGDAPDGARRARTVDSKTLGYSAVVSQVRYASVN